LLTLGGDDVVYHAATHLNKAIRLFKTQDQLVRLARINLSAYRICKQKSAFQDAVNFLRFGLDLIDPGVRWSQHFELAYRLTMSAAKMELAVGNLQACEAMTTQVLLHSTTIPLKANALLVGVERCMVEGNLRELLALTNRSLEVLGVDVHEDVSYRNVAFKMIKVRNMIGRKTDDSLSALPRMKDRVMATAVKILLHRCMFCFCRREKHHSTYAALLATELTLKHGLSPYSPSALAVYVSFTPSLCRHVAARCVLSCLLVS